MPEALRPVAFHVDDRCRLCAMVIVEQPGPKGQKVERDGTKKLCSAAEMLGWWLLPERGLDGMLYVHDMGMALATFAEERDVQNFIAEQGGHLLTFDQIDRDLLESVQRQAPAQQ